MNLLAHAWLSFNQPDILVGNMISDYVKGKSKEAYPAEIQRGIMLHRAIDTFTDVHPSTIAAKQFFRPQYRLYAGAFVDVVYDHFLANDLLEFEDPASLNEFAQSSRVAIRVNEASLPLRETVRGACEILGLDPLYLANEGKLVALVPAADAEALIDTMRAHPAGREAAIVGDVMAAPAGIVMLNTGFGGGRIVDLLVGEQLPRIC